jgi:signal peptidase
MYSRIDDDILPAGHRRDRRRSGPTSPETPVRQTAGRGRVRRGMGEVALTLGALLGVAITALTVLAAQTGLRPLVVRSGSMEPTIQTGSMVLVQRIRADEIRVGDIVAVERPDHTRVTHRVLSIEPRGETVELTMKGDANEDPDATPVTVRHAHRLVHQVPEIGRIAGWLATAQGGFAIGSVVTAVLLTVLRRRPRGPAAMAAVAHA